jgi:hypothetical protein
LLHSHVPLSHGTAPYFPSTFASLRELPVFNKQDSNDML